ncbi:MAG TPA: polysaccharide export protein EpsE [Sulfuriferula sp.]|nr:polysaccharide export protein EpsE [Sulfuriferula sp.]
MRSILYLLFLILTTLALPAAADDYRLGSGDIVHITVYGHPDLNIDARIDEQGKINFPLIGDVPVAGDTASVAQNHIGQALVKGGYIKNAQVNLVVKQYRSMQVSVLGQVNHPGKYPLESTSTVTDLLAMAGGVTLAGSDTLILMHKQDGKTQETKIDIPDLFQGGNADLNRQVSADDAIYVPRAPVFYIYGEVQHPGAFRLEQDMNVMQAISLGGGITPRGTQKGIQIRRRGPAGKVATLNAALTDPVLPDDVVYVKESLF